MAGTTPAGGQAQAGQAATGGQPQMAGQAAAAGLAGEPGQAGAPEAGSGGVSSNGPCDRADLLFCDDFEAAPSDGLPDAAVWSTRINGEGIVSIDAVVAAHSGNQSVRVEATGYQTFFALSGPEVFSAPRSDLFVRVYLRLGAPMSEGHNTYFEAGNTESTDSEYETRIGVMFEQLMINQPASDRGFLSNENYYVDGLPGAQIPAELWSCVEVSLNSDTSEINVWLEGEEVSDLHRTDWQQEPFSELRFGYEKYAGPDAQVWYDDIAVSSQRIGCE